MPVAYVNMVHTPVSKATVPEVPKLDPVRVITVPPAVSPVDGEIVDNTGALYEKRNALEVSELRVVTVTWTLDPWPAGVLQTIWRKKWNQNTGCNNKE